jgi:hypothetical protein
MDGFSDAEQAWPLKDPYKAAILLRARFGTRQAHHTAKYKQECGRKHMSARCVAAWAPVIEILGVMEEIEAAEIDLRLNGEPQWPDATVATPSAFFTNASPSVVNYAPAHYQPPSFAPYPRLHSDHYPRWSDYNPPTPGAATRHIGDGGLRAAQSATPGGGSRFAAD